MRSSRGSCGTNWEPGAGSDLQGCARPPAAAEGILAATASMVKLACAEMQDRVAGSCL